MRTAARWAAGSGDARRVLHRGAGVETATCPRGGRDGRIRPGRSFGRNTVPGAGPDRAPHPVARPLEKTFGMCARTGAGIAPGGKGTWAMNTRRTPVAGGGESVQVRPPESVMVTFAGPVRPAAVCRHHRHQERTRRRLGFRRKRGLRCCRGGVLAGIRGADGGGGRDRYPASGRCEDLRERRHGVRVVRGGSAEGDGAFPWWWCRSRTCRRWRR